MRISSLAIAIGAFVLAAILAGVAARTIAMTVEEASLRGVQEALIDGGHEWASVQADGLQVILEGEAPSEAVRFRAMSIAGGVVDASRVIDAMRVKPSEQIAAPEFKVEILRHEAGLSLIGLIPADTDRDRLTARLSEVADDAEISDFLEMADYPPPPTWRGAMDFAVRALELLPQAKISVTAERVTVLALAASEAEKRRLETTLSRAAPEGVRITLDIAAPRQVVTPFTVRFSLDADGARLEACSADTDVGQRQILQAAVAAGAEGPLACPLALGTPSQTWGEASAMAISAVAELGGGTVTLSDADVRLVAAEGTDRDLFDQVAGRLENALPDLFALDAVLPETLEAPPEGAPEFTATLSDEGAVQVRGRVPDDLVNGMIDNFARARFGAENVTMATRVTEGLPQGWSVRVLSALEALSMLSNGSVQVGPDSLEVRGNTGNAQASAEISRLLLEKLGEDADFDLDISYQESLDPIVGLPTPEECIRRIGIVTQQRRVLFDPGSATLTRESEQVIDDIAEILRQCMDLPLEIAGYTDSQGSEGGNLRLSQNRADAVLTALRTRRVPVGTFTAQGYGEVDPIADNATEEGREANRRIEFRVLPAAGEEVAADGAEDAEADVEGENAEPSEETADDAAE
ncbi:OmpA family protein [Wenxinia marina]|uniref:Outer membrane protein n=1 Tax=Wenxinia marina DSM 24838 TaxID=1123501 RepID=A0A0D0QDF8_9RHOB|nr:OmpA family protein [Wenxinia marina]KIQ70362.1 Outer membrane protein [Wenxinia marina DSM 24838]GGL53737.1 membrane protein [Wenxinia marina]